MLRLTIPVVWQGHTDYELVNLSGEKFDGDRHTYELGTNAPVLRLGLLAPSTNTSMEMEWWNIKFTNREALHGVEIHTTNVLTPKPNLKTEADYIVYCESFKKACLAAVEVAKHALPQYLVIGMSLEGMSGSVESCDDATIAAREISGLGVGAWTQAAAASLRQFGAKRIAVATGFNSAANRNTVAFFHNLGFEVVKLVGFSCATSLDIAMISEQLLEKTLREQLAGEEVDAVIQCGTNLPGVSLLAEKLEAELGVPIIGVNAALLWYALRENGFDTPLVGCGRLLREF